MEIFIISGQGFYIMLNKASNQVMSDLVEPWDLLSATRARSPGKIRFVALE